jgi:hypothetical protein
VLLIPHHRDAHFETVIGGGLRSGAENWLRVIAVARHVAAFSGQQCFRCAHVWRGETRALVASTVEVAT